MITLVVPGSIKQPTGGYRYDAALLAALQQHETPCRLLEIADLRRPEELTSLHREVSPEPHWLVVDGLALSQLWQSHADLLIDFSGKGKRSGHALIALVHHPLCDEAPSGSGLADRRRAQLQALERKVLSAVDLIVTTSRHTEQRIQELFEPEAQILVIEPGLSRRVSPATKVAPSQQNTGVRLRLLCLGSLIPRKGQDLLVEALSIISQAPLHRSNIDCVLAGDTTRDLAFAAAVVESINAAGLTETISLRGALDDAQVDQALQDADVLVLPSWYEGYGMVIDEAMAAGLAIITTNGGALKSTFRPGTGIQIESGDLNALVSAIVRLTDDQEFRLACAKTAAQQKHRNWDEAAAELRLGLELMAAPARRTDLFDIDWLRLREPVDHAARNNMVTAALQEWVQAAPDTDAESALAVVDLGAGLGSNLNYLMPRIEKASASSSSTSAASYFAVDHDPIMLSELKLLMDTRVVDADLQRTEVLASVISECFVAPAAARLNGYSRRLVTASALLDLVNPEWMSVLLRTAAEHHSALLFALSVNGHWTLDPPDKFDATINRLFNAHQQAGGGCGSDAAACFESVAGAFGFSTLSAPSYWQLSAATSNEQRELLSRLIGGWEAAIREQLIAEHRSGAAAGHLLLQAERWFDLRRKQIKTARLSLELGHTDVFATPAGKNSHQDP